MAIYRPIDFGDGTVDMSHLQKYSYTSWKLGTVELKRGTVEFKQGTVEFKRGTVEFKRGTTELKRGTVGESQKKLLTLQK